MEEAWKLSIFVTVGEEVGGGGGGQVGTREREDNKWKSARSTLKVRKNTIFFIENISYVEFVFFFLFVCNNSINPCNKNKQHRLKARPTMLHIGLKRTKAASNEQTC